MTLLTNIWSRVTKRLSAPARCSSRDVSRPDTIELIGAAYDTPGGEVAGRTLIICAAPRTGSYELSRLLVAAGVGTPHEYFHPGYAQTAASRWGISGDPLCENNIAAYIDALRMNRVQSGVFATKLQYWQFNGCLRNRHGVDLFKNASIVHVFRPDIVRQFESMRVAMVTGCYDFSPRASRPPQPDGVDDASNALDMLLEEDAGLRRLFVLFGKSPLFVTTADIFDRPRETVARIAQSVDVRVNEAGLAQMLTTSAPYVRDSVVERKVGGTISTLRELALKPWGRSDGES